jgi:hypothetical protein
MCHILTFQTEEGIAMAVARRKEYQNTTVRLPRQVYELAKTAVEKSEAASSFNDFVVQAIEQKLQQLTEAEIDAAFTHMADDFDYQRDAVASTKEFEKSDWEVSLTTDTANARAPKTRASKTHSR